MFSFMRKWAVSPGYADIANLGKYSQVGAGISRAFGDFGALLSKRASGVALDKSGGLPVVNFKICPDFLKRIFSCNKGSIMGNMSNLARFSEYAYNNYNGTYEKCWKEAVSSSSISEGISGNRQGFGNNSKKFFSILRRPVLRLGIPSLRSSMTGKEVMSSMTVEEVMSSMTGKKGKKEASFLEVRGASLRQGILSLRSAIFLKNGRSLDGAEHRGMTGEKGNVILSGVLTERRIQQHRRCCSFRWNEWILRRCLRMTREQLLSATTVATTVVA